MKKIILFAAVVATFLVVKVVERGDAATSQLPTGSISAAAVVHGDNALEYQLTWAAGTSPVTLYVSEKPDERGTEVASGLTSGAYTWQAHTKARRYFTLEAADGSTVHTASRLLPLEGGRNFRDMGGYKTGDGRTVKWGKIFRSGTMAFLTDDDYGYLRGLGVKTVCDYRSSAEREVEPTNWRAGEIEYLAHDYSSAQSSNGLRQIFAKPDVTPADVKAAMAGFYHTIAYEHADKYKEMFAKLAAGDMPLAFNCSAGKDRAGTSAALLLTALGVPRETVVADYALSDKLVDYMAVFAKRDAAQKPQGQKNPYAFLSQLPRDLVAPLMASDPDYIRATFAHLEAEHGSVMNFIQNELGVTDEMLVKIRSQLLI